MHIMLPVRRAMGLQGADESPVLSIVILYDDICAGQRAMHVLNNLCLQLLGQSVEMRPHLWRFDLLADSEWFSLALADAINADMLVVSTSSASGFPVVLENWLKLCLARKRGTSAAIVALLGSSTTPDAPDSPRFQLLQGMARAGLLDFFAPGTVHDSSLGAVVDETQRRVEVAHPSLEISSSRPPPAFCSRHAVQPYQRWGLNE